MIADLGGLGATEPAHAAGDYRPGTASEPGVNEEAFDYNAKDSEEVVAKRKADRDAAARKEAEETQKFRQLFTDFASDTIDSQKRAELLDAMKNKVIEKSYMKLLAGIDKVNDRSLLSAR